MVVIRLARYGTKHKPKYRVMVADSRRSPTGRFIENIGYYHVFNKDKKQGFKLNMESYKKWLACGAQPSLTVRNLVKKVYDSV